MTHRKWLWMVVLLACWFPALLNPAHAQTFTALESMQIQVWEISHLGSLQSCALSASTET